jgi:phage baseplate assembly protein W
MAYKNIIVQPANYSQQHKQKTSQFYKGFSSIDETQSTTEMFDFDLVKQDLMNHFSTHRGERVMNPEFGSVIWGLIYEPLTADTKRLIEDDITRILASDPRITVQQININEQLYGFLLEVTLQYVGTSQVEVMRLNFDKNAGLSIQ